MSHRFVMGTAPAHGCNGRLVLRCAVAIILRSSPIIAAARLSDVTTSAAPHRGGANASKTRSDSLVVYVEGGALRARLGESSGKKTGASVR